MLFMLNLPSCHFLDEIHKRSLLIITPNFRFEDLALMAPLLCLEISIASEEVSQFSEDGDDCIEVEHEGCTDERNGEGKELDLEASLRCDITITDCSSSHDQFIQNDVILWQSTLFISKSAHFVSQHY